MVEIVTMTMMANIVRNLRLNKTDTTDWWNKKSDSPLNENYLIFLKVELKMTAVLLLVVCVCDCFAHCGCHVSGHRRQAMARPPITRSSLTSFA